MDDCSHKGEQLDVTTWGDAARGVDVFYCVDCGGAREEPCSTS